MKLIQVEWAGQVWTSNELVEKPDTISRKREGVATCYFLPFLSQDFPAFL
jgi:hypothetical protein